MSSVKTQLNKIVEEDWERLGLQDEIFRQETIEEGFLDLQPAKIEFYENDDINTIQEDITERAGQQHADNVKITVGWRGHC